MKFTLHHLLLIFAVLMLSGSAKSQQSVDLTKKVVRLFELFNEHHLNPRSVDAPFVEDVTTAFLEAIDPDAILFSSEDLKTIDGYAQLLTEIYHDKIFKTVILLTVQNADNIHSIQHLQNRSRMKYGSPEQS